MRTLNHDHKRTFNDYLWFMQINYNKHFHKEGDCLMDKNEAANQHVTISWWNFGKKTLDYKGTYQGYLDKRDIKVEDIVHPNDKDYKGLRFKISVSSATCTFDIFDINYERCYFEAIKIFLSMMGDKTQIITNRWEQKVNW